MVLCKFFFIYAARIYLLNVSHTGKGKKKGFRLCLGGLWSIWELAYKQIHGCAVLWYCRRYTYKRRGSRRGNSSLPEIISVGEASQRD